MNNKCHDIVTINLIKMYYIDYFLKKKWTKSKNIQNFMMKLKNLL